MAFEVYPAHIEPGYVIAPEESARLFRKTRVDTRRKPFVPARNASWFRQSLPIPKVSPACIGACAIHSDPNARRVLLIHYITTQGLGDAWVGNELRVVKQAGIPFRLHSMRRSERQLFARDWARQLEQQTNYLYPLPKARFVASVLLAPYLFRGRFFSALVNALIGERESLRARVATLFHLLVACHWARQLRREEVSHIHSQWIHSAGSIGMYGAWLLGVSFSFTGHAADLFRNRAALKDKIRRADFIICISTFHRDFFLKQGARDDQLEIAYCGIDTSLFVPMERGKAASRLTILSSGRLVEKKGFSYLIDACQILAQRGIDVVCHIAGSGELHESLLAQIDRLGMVDRVFVTGQELVQEEIPAFMAKGDIYCLPCVWASDDDVDGLPQMLMEAMACGLPVVSTRLVGIPDLVLHEQTGLLCEPRNARQVADALERLYRDKRLASALARAGRAWVLERFDIESSLDVLLSRFRGKLELPDKARQRVAAARTI
jgi:glycosyltransferase involved in cell wall biosynthesis